MPGAKKNEVLLYLFQCCNCHQTLHAPGNAACWPFLFLPGEPSNIYTLHYNLVNQKKIFLKRIRQLSYTK